jgi:hypothetical protein
MSGRILGALEWIHGDTPWERAFNVLITGDGFAESDQQLLDAHADTFAELLQQENWFQVFGSVINVLRLNIASEDSGVTEPVVDQDGNCTGEITPRSTFFDAEVTCNEEGRVELLTINHEKVAELHAQPEMESLVVHVLGIIFNTEKGRGWASSAGFVLSASDWERAVVHEFAHAAFHVLDEYQEDPGVVTEPSEPTSANVTIAGALDTLKWKHFIFPNIPAPALQNPNVPIPTLENPDHQNCPTIDLPNPLDDDLQIGLFEGANHHSCAYYRPAYDCKMGPHHRQPLCRVCIDAGLRNLSSFAPQAPVPQGEIITSDGTLILRFGDVPFGETMYRSFEIQNTRDGWPAPLYVGLSGQVQSESGSSEGALSSVQRIRFSVDAPGTVQATLTWERSPEVIRHQGHIAAASTDGTPAQVEIPMEIIGNRDLSATLDLFADDADLDLELRDSSDTTVATAGNGTSESLLLSNPALGTYKLVVTNNSQIETDFRLGVAAEFRPMVRAVLLDSIGLTVATFASASPATLSHDVPRGEYTFELENNFWRAPSYHLDFTYPKSDPHLQDSNFAFDPGTETSFIVPAPVIDDAWSRTVFVGFTAPETLGESSTTLDVYTNDPANAHIQIELRGTAVNPQPLDAVLVIDRSGSMREPSGIPDISKSEMSIEAGKLFVSLLRRGDRIGIVRYNHVSNDTNDVLTNDVLLHMTDADEPGKTQATAALSDSNLDPDGNTSIGAGIIRGSTVLDEPDVLRRRAILVLTDGIQNRNPGIPDAQAVVEVKDPPQNVFAVGFGLNQLEDTLNEIATATNGYAQITGELAGWREFILQKLYVQILADATNEAIIRDPREVVLAGDIRSTDIYLSKFDHSTDVIVLFRPLSKWQADVRVALETPHGDLLAWPNRATARGIEVIEGDSHICFRVNSLGKKSFSGPGLWRVWVENTNRPFGGQPTDKGAVVYAVMCKARSHLRLNGYMERSSVNSGESLKVIFDPVLNGRRYPPVSPGFAFVQPPEGAIERINLYASRSGRIRGIIENTQKVGPYIVWTEMYFHAPGEITTTRFRQVCGLVLKKKSDEGVTIARFWLNRL